jgi:hypothetical protein
VNRDEQMAKLSLTLDPKERENLMAEHRKWEAKRRAEEWRWIAGYDGIYSVSDLGRVRSHKNGLRIMSATIAKRGYRTVALMRNGERSTRYVHHLVAEAFVGPRPDGMDCAHLDGTRTNNVPSNLRWVTRKENLSHRVTHGTMNYGAANGSAKLTADDALVIRRLASTGTRQRVIARKYGVCQQAISNVVRGKTWGWAP